MKRVLNIVFALVIVSSCKQSSDLDEKEKMEIVSDVRETLENYCADIAKSGLTAEFKYLDSSSEFFWVPPGYTSSISYSSVATVIKQNAPKYKSVVNSFEGLKIIPLSKSLASYTGHLKSKMTDTTGKQMVFSLAETGVVIKRENGWKLLNGQTSILSR